MDGEVAREALFDRGIIAALERGEDHMSAVEAFVDRMEREYGATHVYTGGAEDLRVVEVDGPFKVDEYDGSESIVLRAETEWFAWSV
jgi:hypothetical protein